MLSVLLFIGIRDIKAQIGNRYDVVIDEIMADPTPQAGLPNNEWIELKNTSSSAINLQGWRIGDASGISGPMPNFLLQPDSFVIVCTSSAVAAMSSFGKTISVTSFPSLDNDGDEIYLRSLQGSTIHAVRYSLEWYQNEVKKDGGWSLEMIDTKNPCGGMSNWKASVNAIGGTPGKKNSVDGVNTDSAPPQLKRSFTPDASTIVLLFNEPLDSTSASSVSNYSIGPAISISSAVAIAPFFDAVQLKLSSVLQAGTVYTVTAGNVTDCKGNSIGIQNSTKTGLPQEAAINDVVINEILFNPRPDAFDYVEFYNRSNKIIDVAQLSMANRSSTGVIGSVKKLSGNPFLLFPGEYIVVTEDVQSLAMNYLVKNIDQVFILSSLPSFPDEGGTVVLLNAQGIVVDEVKYDDDWHFDLIANDEGVAVERIDPNGPSQDKGNWHSAASPAGYGTPGYQNSQYKQAGLSNATLELTPKVFSPDNDGRDDVATIQYSVSQSGYVANITIFDSGGRPVRMLVKNAILGLKGSWSWDGLGEKGQKLPIGTYIIYTEIFNLDGKKERFKNTVVLGRRFN
jgi:hypothetical protein